VALWLVVLERPGSGGNRSGFTHKRTGPTAVRARLIVAKSLGLFGGCRLQASGRHPSHHSISYLFHVGEIDVQVGTIVTVGVAADNLAPVATEFEQRLLIL
jgi:hypothetical protein